MKETQLKLLLNPTKVGAWELKTRTAMAPMTRCFADPETAEVGPHIVEYYRKRAADGIGVIISEGTIVSPRGKGYAGTPGIYNQDQVKAWSKVTEAVHNEGGKIICQLWHVGRISHPEITGGNPPLAPSAIKPDGLVSRLRKPYEMPAEMTTDQIKEAVQQFAQAAKYAMEAGFDGVEVHGAHGYLIDQFNSDISNKREDKYGGPLTQRLTFMKEVLENVLQQVGEDRTLIRFSALKVDNPEYMWEDPEEAIYTFTKELKSVGIKMIHPSTMTFKKEIQHGQTMHQLVRKHWDQVIFGVGDLDPDTAEEALAQGTIDVAVFGRPLLANPDFLERVSQNKPIEEYVAKEHLKQLI